MLWRIPFLALPRPCSSSLPSELAVLSLSLAFTRGALAESCGVDFVPSATRTLARLKKLVSSPKEVKDEDKEKDKVHRKTDREDKDNGKDEVYIEKDKR